jgi:4-amino-4-deoxy-L-arabinose transferase-like glycosyltransferase
MSISRPWLAVVFALFCLPLFVGLGRGDVQDDEAIYSFGVDRLLESGDWLAPKSSPHEDAAFLEKPPLKFWIVGLPIQVGLLPHTEFGLRFWDALFGAAGFLYVFAIGSRLAGAACGVVAVLMLFVHPPLLFEHGLRTNNMEAALFLCYCGGVFHFIEWSRQTRGLHACAVGLYFVLGFMTKFVAALFLPLVLGVAALIVPAYRRGVLEHWRQWLKVLALVAGLCAPWFIYAHIRFGAALWRTILAEHVYTRFTAYLDPEHLHPWYYYPWTMYQRFEDAGVAALVIGGLALLLVQTIRRRWAEGTVVLLWFALPTFLISLGTSKLYHYAYPFLPPLAIAGGYLVALVLALAPVPCSRALARFNDWASRRGPGLLGTLRRGVPKALLLVLAGVSIAVAITAIVYGPIVINIGERELFRSSGVFRPMVVAVVGGVLAGAVRSASRAFVAVIVVSMLPLGGYRTSFAALAAAREPKRAASDCILRVEESLPGPPRGLYLDLPDRVIGHPLYYYYRRIRPWIRPPDAQPQDLARYLYDPQEWRPILVWAPRYQEFRRHPASAAAVLSPPMVAFTNDVLLLLPGPYAVCSAEEGGPQELR